MTRAGLRARRSRLFLRGGTLPERRRQPGRRPTDNTLVAGSRLWRARFPHARVRRIRGLGRLLLVVRSGQEHVGPDRARAGGAGLGGLVLFALAQGRSPPAL